jgi:hypothetical protein
MMRAMVIASAASLLAFGSVEAQQSSSLMQASAVWFAPVQGETSPARPARTAANAQSYWLEGLVIGGTLGAIVGGVFVGGTCGDTDSGSPGGCFGPTIGGVLVGALIGAVPGVLIGGRFKKHPKAVESAQPQ